MPDKTISSVPEPPRFGMYVPPLMEHLGLAEVEHNPRGNRMRAR
jgi:hypothetical protein